jgi:hypothetical protein
MGIATFLRDRPATRPHGLQWVALTEQAVIEAMTSVDDGGGGADQTWLARGTADCRIYPVSARRESRLVGGAISEQTTHFVEMVAQTEVQLTDRIVVGNRGTFEVTAVPQRTGALTTVVEVWRRS